MDDIFDKTIEKSSWKIDDERRLIIWTPNATSVKSANRFYTDDGSHNSSMNVPGMPTEVCTKINEWKSLNIDSKNLNSIKIGDFKFRSKSIKKIIDIIRSRFEPFWFSHPENVFKFEMVNELFKKSLHDEIILFPIWAAPRSRDLKRRPEVIWSFGAETKIRTDKIDRSFLKYEHLIFDFILGGKLTCEQGEVNLQLIDIIFDFENMEINYQVNENNLSMFNTILDNTINGPIEVKQPNLSLKRTDKSKPKMWSDENQVLPNSNEDEIVNKILIARESNLSKRHHIYLNKTAKYLKSKGFDVYAELYKHIDLYARKNGEALLIEVKTALSEIYKGIGQIEYYEQLISESEFNSDHIQKIILFDKEYKISEVWEKTLSKLDIIAIHDIELLNNH